MIRFTRPERGVLRTTIDGVTYTATWYRSGGPGTRAYWTIQASDRDYSDGNDWYEPSERRVREAIVAVAQRVREGKRDGGAAAMLAWREKTSRAIEAHRAAHWIRNEHGELIEPPGLDFPDDENNEGGAQ